MSLLIVFAGAGGTPADTGTLGFAALPATLAFNVQNTPPAATETLGFASLPATLAFGVLNVNPETLGVVSFPATVAFNVQNTAPPSTETLGFVSFPATLTFGVVAANNAGSFSVIARPAVLSFGVQQSLGETLGFASLPSTLSFNVTASGGSGPAPYSPPIPIPYRDDDAYVYQSPSIVDLIEQTNEFVAVTFSRLPNDARLTAEEGSAALLTPLGWTEKNEGSERRKNRTCNYQLTLAYLAEEVETAHQEADRLVAVVSNALLGGTNAGISYGGFTLPWRNTIGGGSLDASSHPEYRVTMRGSFSYSYDVGAAALRTTVSQA